jgi:hypothetical protein
MFADKFNPPTKRDFLLAFYACLGGLIGGIFLSILEGSFSVPNLVGGTLAGFIGVVLFNIDRSDWVRLVVAAILCGISWASVLETGKQFINIKAAETNTAKAKELAGHLEATSEAALPVKIEEVASSASEAVMKSANVSAPVQTRLNDDLTDVVTKLNELAPKEPEKVVDALSSVGSTAGRSRNLSVWKLSSESLKKLSLDRSLPADTREKANKAYEQLKTLE